MFVQSLRHRKDVRAPVQHAQQVGIVITVDNEMYVSINKKNIKKSYN